MLSETNTIVDVKERLENDYSFFSFDSDEIFESVLETISEDVKRIYFYPRIGTSEYARIAALDKVDLLQTEENLYWAEVYTICYEFLRSRNIVSGQLQTSSDEALRVEGYEYRTKASAGASPNDVALNGYREKMFQYFKLAGFNLMALQRTCFIFGDSSSDDEILNIIE